MALMWPLFILAQNPTTTIKVGGYALHKDASPTYRAIVTLGSPYSSLPADVIALSALKTQYQEILASEGIPWGELKENPNDFGAETMGYERDVALLMFETPSAAQMKTFLRIKSPGLQQLSALCVFFLDQKELQILAEKALADATEKANVLAGAVGKKLGDIITVEDMNHKWGRTLENSLYYDRAPHEYKYTIDVTFALIEP